MGQLVRYSIRFDGLDAHEAGQAVESLRRSLQDVNPAIQSKRVRNDPEALDFGTVLEVILAAPAIVELARGIANWLGRTHSSKVTVLGSDGTTIVENVSTREAASLAQKLQAWHGDR